MSSKNDGKFSKLKETKSKSSKNKNNYDVVINEKNILAELKRSNSDSSVHFYVQPETEKERVMSKDEYYYKHHLPSFKSSLPNSPKQTEIINEELNHNELDLCIPTIKTLNRSLSLSTNQFEISLSRNQKEHLEQIELISNNPNLLLKQMKIMSNSKEENEIITVEKLEDRNYSYPKSIFHKEEVEKAKRLMNRKSSLSFISRYSVYETEQTENEEEEQEKKLEENERQKNISILQENKLQPSSSKDISSPTKMKKVLQEIKDSENSLTNFDNILHMNEKEKDVDHDDGKDLIEIKGKNTLWRKVMMKFKTIEVMMNTKKKSTSKTTIVEEDKENFSSF